jgi:hypothetical protein
MGQIFERLKAIFTNFGITWTPSSNLYKGKVLLRAKCKESSLFLAIGLYIIYQEYLLTAHLIADLPLIRRTAP